MQEDRNAYFREHYQKNKEKILEQRAKIRDANHKELSDRHKRYYEKNRQAKLDYQKARYYLNKVKNSANAEYAKKGVTSIIKEIKVKKEKTILAKYFRGDLETKLNIFKLAGFYYKDGEVYSAKHKLNNTSILRLCNSKYNMTVSKNQFVWFWFNGYQKVQLHHIDGNNRNSNINNLKVRTVYDNGFKKGEDHISKSIIFKRFNSTKFIVNTELVYNIIIDQAKGKLSKKTTDMLISLANNLSNKFYYKDNDLRYDCVSESILSMLDAYHNFNYIRHDNAFAYFTEVAKRSMAKCLNQFTNVQYYNKIKYKTKIISLSQMYY